MKSKTWITLALAGMMAVSAVGLVACGGNNPPDETTYTLTYTANGGTGADVKEQHKEGETVVLKGADTFTYEGHVLTAWTQGTNEFKLGGTFLMPGEDITLSAKWEETGSKPLADAWHNQSIWLQKDPLVPEQAAKLPQGSFGRTTDGVAVHDPSIFQDPNARGTKYYAFGTHFAVASSTDLIYWEQEAKDNNWHVLYGDEQSSKYYGWPKALESSLDIVRPGSDVSTTWAPDVEYMNGKYYMYYSITKAFGSNQSVIGRVEADSPLGPYSNNVVILESVTSGDENKPNCIDPELFYDKDGKLWMVYGSFFGGIYLKELYTEDDPATPENDIGLLKEKEGWGTLLWRNGYQAGVEGPYIFYNASTEYYYLMVSEGDLNTVYNMRVARSKTPDGPYTDITGKDVATADGKGNKIAGNYTFSWASGYAAMGHNSVIKDKSGRYFVVYHTRRESGGGGVSAPHNLYVSQLYFNEEGWPVMSPNAYVGEKRGTVEESALAGEYEIVEHTVETGDKDHIAWAHSVKYSLTADGKVMSGTTEAGSWVLKQNYYVEVTIGTVTYKGVVAPGWNMYTDNGGTYSITAVSETGRSLWGIKA